MNKWPFQQQAHIKLLCNSMSFARNALSIPSDGTQELTRRGRDKLAAISQTMFSNAFSLISIKISLKFNPKAPNRRQAIIWNNDGLCCRCIYASLGLIELMLASCILVIYTKNHIALKLTSLSNDIHIFNKHKSQLDIADIPSMALWPYSNSLPVGEAVH